MLLYLPYPCTSRPKFPSSLQLLTLPIPQDCQYGLCCVTKSPEQNGTDKKERFTDSEHSIRWKHIVGPSIFLFWNQSQVSRQFSSTIHLQIFVFSDAFIFYNYCHQSFLLSRGRSWSAWWYPKFTVYSDIKWFAPHFCLSSSSEISTPQIKWSEEGRDQTIYKNNKCHHRIAFFCPGN